MTTKISTPDNHIETSPNKKSKSNNFLHNIQKSIRNTLMSIGVVAGMGGEATAPTIIPASIETIATITAPATKIITAGTAASLLVACNDPDEPEIKDTTPPNINLYTSQIDISGGKQIKIEGNQLLIGGELVASRSDNSKENCIVKLSLNGNTISSGSMLNSGGTLTIQVIDPSGNSKTENIKLNIDESYDAPSIQINKSEINIFGGTNVTISNNQLIIGDETIASRSSEHSPIKSISLSFNGKEISSGTTINEAGKLTLTITVESGKSSTIEIDITNDAIYGLENIKNLDIQVDHEINILEGLTFAEGISLEGAYIQMNSSRQNIDPSHFMPEYPGTCSIIFVVKTPNGQATEIVVDNLTIKPLDYATPSIESANPIDTHYARYNNLTPKTKEFIYNHLLTSYICMDRFQSDDTEYIIMGEFPESTECENVGQTAEGRKSSHADRGYRNIHIMAPNSTIKACGGNRQNLENYINQHPDKKFMISCATDALGCSTLEKLKMDPYYNTLKTILEKENVIISVASTNRSGGNLRKIPNESIQVEGLTYSSTSVNSNKNNKITVTGYNANQNNIFHDDSKSRLPIGFGQGNIIIPFIPLVRENNKEDTNTTSSYPTAAESGSLGNFLSILMHTHPGTTLEDAMTIMINNYLRAETFKYKDENGNIVNGDQRYFFDTDKFINEEILHQSAINSIKLSGDDVSLPSYDGVYYTGKGMQFEYLGHRYDITNQNKLQEALKSGQNIQRYWNKKLFLKQGGTNTANFDVHMADKSGKEIPDIQLKNISKTVH